LNRLPLRFAVVGGGVSGLAAARRLWQLGQEHKVDVEVTLLEAGPQVGGRVAAESFAGVRLDLGAESLLARSPATWELLSALGLAEQALAPGTTTASIWNGRRLVRIPAGSALGVPPHPWSGSVLRALGLGGALRAGLEPWLGHPRPDPDSALGPFISRRVGVAVLSRLVDPLLGGVYAGSAAQLSLGAVAPQLLQALDRSPSLLKGLRQLERPTTSVADPPRPTFVTFAGGLTTLVAALRASLPQGAVQLESRVDELLPAAVQGAARLVVAGAPGFDCHGVVLAVPAPEAAGIVAGISPELAGALRRQDWASVASPSCGPRWAAPATTPSSPWTTPR
jgi:oxygen-dependent protoporphyrinogen oxidase